MDFVALLFSLAPLVRSLFIGVRLLPAQILSGRGGFCAWTIPDQIGPLVTEYVRRTVFFVTAGFVSA